MDFKEPRPCVIGTAGHIDHGKTTLVAALTGTDTDRLPEEKRRGMSIDLGFAALDLGDKDSPRRAGLIDVPGHERFIRNMLAGATGIDVALFCVAADDGIMPQTREHFEIIRLLGVRECVFAVTKSDCVTPERLNEVMEAVAGLTRTTALAGSAIIPVSAKTGTGIDGLKGLLRQAAARAIRPDELSNKPFRLPIDRSFHVKGFGTVVTGTVASGSVKKGDELICYPSGAIVKVRGIESLHAAIDEARAGQRTAVNIIAPPDTYTGRGVMLVSTELRPFVEAALKRPAYAECSFEFIRDIDLKKGRKTFKAHHLTAESVVTIRLADGRTDCGRLTMRPPLLALRNDRLILRDTGRNETVGVAVVNALWLDKKTMPKKPLTSFFAPSPIVRGTHANGRGSGWGEGEGGAQGESLPPLQKGRRGGFLLRRILEGCSGIKLAEAALIFNMRKERLSDAVAKDPALSVRGQYLMDSKTAIVAEGRILDSVDRYHASNPTEPGMREDAALKASGLKDALVAKAVLDGLIAKGALIAAKNGAAIATPGFSPASTGIDAKIEAAIKAIFPTGFTPCSPEDLARLPHKKTDVDRVLAWLVRDGAIIRLCEGSYLSAGAVAEARARLTAHLKTKTGAGANIKAAEFRDILGCGRKLAIEILEYFDKERVTLRQGDIRTLR